MDMVEDVVTDEDRELGVAVIRGIEWSLKLARGEIVLPPDRPTFREKLEMWKRIAEESEDEE